VYSTTLDLHSQHLTQVLQMLKDHQLSAKQSKRVFGVQTIEYLGHVISAQGVATYPTKITAMQE
jgi:hypothetical protein